jgi:5-formyltetrahydrofolate cyclo-ligase
LPNGRAFLGLLAVPAEFDPRPLIDWAVAVGRTVALPVVVDKGAAEYRAWQPGEPLVDGVWNIPVPEKRKS